MAGIDFKDVKIADFTTQEICVAVLTVSPEASITYRAARLGVSYVAMAITEIHLERPFLSLKDFADLVVMSDVLTKVQAIVRTPVDTVTATDSAIRALSRTLTDSMTFADSAAIVYSAVRVFVETVTPSDSTSFLAGKNTSETLTMTDAKAIALLQTYADSVTATDSRVSSFLPVFSDSLSTSDSIFTVMGLSFSLADSIAMSDTILSMPNNSVESSVPNVSTIGTYMINY